MNWFIKFILPRICRRIVRQGPHRQNIDFYLRTLVVAHEREFTEDNVPTRDAFLKECLDRALAVEVKRQTPPPGSAEAIAGGCICPPGDNQHGKGWNGESSLFFVERSCKLHGVNTDWPK